jgi:hypothetical protein
MVRISPLQRLSAVIVGLAVGIGFIYFPVLAFIVLAASLVFAKNRWLKPVPRPVLGAMILGLGLMAWILQTS